MSKKVSYRQPDFFSCPMDSRNVDAYVSEGMLAESLRKTLARIAPDVRSYGESLGPSVSPWHREIMEEPEYRPWVPFYHLWLDRGDRLWDHSRVGMEAWRQLASESDDTQQQERFRDYRYKQTTLAAAVTVGDLTIDIVDSTGICPTSSSA